MNLNVWLGGGLALTCAVFSLGSLLAGQLVLATLFHLAGAMFGGFASHQPTGSGRAYEYVVALAIPCVGGLIAWGHAAGELLNPQTNVGEEFADYIDPAQRLGQALLPTVRESRPPSPDELAPMTDVLNSRAAVDDKRRAVEVLLRLGTPEAVETLKEALTNAHIEVRFYAASALAIIEKRLAARLEELEAELLTAPRGETGVRNGEIARVLFDYAYFNLVDDVSRKQYLTRVVEHAERAVAHGDSEALIVLGRAFLALLKFADAEATFATYICQNENEGKGYLWRAEARFRQADYRGVREDCNLAGRFGSLPEMIRPAVDFWTGYKKGASSILRRRSEPSA